MSEEEEKDINITPPPMDKKDDSRGVGDKKPTPLVVKKRGPIVWDDASGLPVPSESAPLSKVQVDALVLTTMSLPYEVPPKPEEPKSMIGMTEREEAIAWAKYKTDLSLYIEGKKFEGLTNAEVMMIRMSKTAADGDTAVTEKLLDRVLGKAMQSSEVKTMTVTYEEYTAQLAKEANDAKAKIVDVEEAPIVQEEQPIKEEQPAKEDKPFGSCNGLDTDGLGELL